MVNTLSQAISSACNYLFFFILEKSQAHQNLREKDEIIKTVSKFVGFLFSTREYINIFLLKKSVGAGVGVCMCMCPIAVMSKF